MPRSSKPHVSVITAAYNAEKYLKEAVESVLIQTGEFEHLIVDDGSSDGTAEIAQSFGDPRIRYERQENAGPAAARNRGLELAKGEYALILDADDRLTPDAMAKKSACMDKSPDIDAVFGNQYCLDDDGVI